MEICQNPILTIKLQEIKMDKTMYLNRRHIDRIKQLFDQFPENGEYASVILSQSEDNGIGTIIKATFNIFYKDIEGDFTVTISDEQDW